MRASRTLLTTAVTVTMAAALGACGSTPAPSVTSPGASGSATASATASGVALGDTVPLTALAARIAAAVAKQRTAHVTMTQPDSAESGEADVRFDAASPAVAMTMGSGRQQTDLVLLDGVVHVGSEDYRDLTGGKRWVRLDPEATDFFSQLMSRLVGMMTASMQDPGEQLAALGDREATVSSIVNGTTVYRVTLDREDLAAMVQRRSGAVPGVGTVPADELPTTASWTVALDGSDLPKLLEASLAGATVTVDYSRWGEPVDITAPPASEIGVVETPGQG